MSCRALAEGCSLVQVPRKVLLRFFAARPRTLQAYVQRGIARLWRVSHFSLQEYLHLPPGQAAGGAHAARVLSDDEAAVLAEAMLPAQPLPAAMARNSANGSSELQGSQSVYLSQRLPTLPGFKGILVPEATTTEASPRASALHRLIQPLAGILRTRKLQANASTARRKVSFDNTQLREVLSAHDHAATTPAESTAAAAGTTAASLHAATAALFTDSNPKAAPLHDPESTAAASPALVQTRRAGLHVGWDVVEPEDSGLDEATLALLSVSGPGAVARLFTLAPGQLLHGADEAVRQFTMLLQVRGLGMGEIEEGCTRL